MPKAQPSNPPQEPEIPFERAIEELEAIVKDMESQRLPLDQLIAKYERGNQLLKTCQTRIEQAEQRIELIAAGGNLVPFDAASAASAAAAMPSEKAPESSAPPNPAGSDPTDEIKLF